MKSIKKTPFAAAMGAAFISTFASAAVNAEANPFGMTELPSGYMQVAEVWSNKKSHTADTATDKVGEKKCAGMNMPADKMQGGEGKCGQGMCGGMMQGDKMKPGMEMMCGEMMKGKEGKCGASGNKE